MVQVKQNASMPGVAEGRALVGVSTAGTLTAEDKARFFISGAMSGEYTVCCRPLLFNMDSYT